MESTRLFFVPVAVPKASIKLALRVWLHLEICGDKTVKSILNYVIFILLPRFQAAMVSTEKMIRLVFKFVISKGSTIA